MKKFVVCSVSELPPGEKKIVEVEGKSIGVFNVHGEFYALRNICPHQFAPLCLGKITGYNAPSAVGEFNWCKEGEIIRCPWHAWEFDIKTGRSVFNPHKVRTATYRVTQETGAPPSGENEDPSVETFSVTTDKDQVVLHI